MDVSSLTDSATQWHGDLRRNLPRGVDLEQQALNKLLDQYDHVLSRLQHRQPDGDGLPVAAAILAAAFWGAD